MTASSTQEETSTSEKSLAIKLTREQLEALFHGEMEIGSLHFTMTEAQVDALAMAIAQIIS